METKSLAWALIAGLLLLAMPGLAAAAGHIAPTGVTSREASQLVVWYDEGIDDGLESLSLFQVTNGSSDTGVNIHVQIFADDSDDPANGLCREHDFNDTLTPSDTIVYVIGELDNPYDGAPATRGGNNAHAAIPIDVDNTRGFIVVTAVDTVTLPRLAISHNHLFGSIFIIEDGDGRAMSFNAMGRQAVDFATGALLGDGIILDGVTTGLQLIQPAFLSFAFNDREIGDGIFSSDQASVNSIAITDNYADPNGEYRAEPATAVWDPLMFDQLENGVSCQQHINACFVSLGLNDDWEAVIDRNTSYPEIELCPAVDSDGEEFDGGWAKIAVSGISGLDSHFGIFGLNRASRALASWMVSE